MGPKKQMRSPFGLFMTKKRSEDKSLNNKPMNEMVRICNEQYQRLSPQVKTQLQALSELIRNKSLNESQIMDKLNNISLNSQNNNNNNSNNNNNNNNETIDVQNRDICELNSKTSETAIEVSDDESDEDLVEDYWRVKNAVESVVEVKTMAVIVVSFNVSVQTFDGISYPIEVSFTKFSLKEGIEDTYHQLIYNPIPKGYYSVAKEFSEKTHEIPLNPEEDFGFEKNYTKIFEEIHSFMSLSGLKNNKSGKQLIFCKSDGKGEIRQIVGCLKWLANEVKKDNHSDYKSLIEHFEVIDLSELLFVFHQKMSSRFRPRSLASDDLSKSVYDYYRLNCHFHQQKENIYCTLGVTKRVVYLFFDSLFVSLKPEMDIKSTDNHKPEEEKIGSEISRLNYTEVKHKRKHDFRYYSSCGNSGDNRNDDFTYKKRTNSSVGIHKSGDIRKPFLAGIGRGLSIEKKKVGN